VKKPLFTLGYRYRTRESILHSYIFVVSKLERSGDQKMENKTAVVTEIGPQRRQDYTLCAMHTCFVDFFNSIMLIEIIVCCMTTTCLLELGLHSACRRFHFKYLKT
jgi:hypothetical protein